MHDDWNHVLIQTTLSSTQLLIVVRLLRVAEWHVTPLSACSFCMGTRIDCNEFNTRKTAFRTKVPCLSVGKHKNVHNEHLFRT